MKFCPVLKELCHGFECAWWISLSDSCALNDMSSNLKNLNTCADNVETQLKDEAIRIYGDEKIF